MDVKAAVAWEANKPLAIETVQLDGLRVQVLRADSRRVHTLLVDPQRGLKLAAE